jgi:hypothetical protein
MVADGQGNLVIREACPDQNVSSMAHLAARDFGFLTLIQAFDGPDL